MSNIIFNGNPEARYVLRVTNNGGILQTTGPITLKNHIGYRIESVESIPDVNIVSRVEGATLVYNATTDKYDVKPISYDGGEF